VVFAGICGELPVAGITFEGVPGVWLEPTGSDFDGATPAWPVGIVLLGTVPV
jgi:hypothetical protein